MEKIKAIIVDDEPGNCDNLTGLLATYCPKVRVIKSAYTIKDALEIILSNDINLIFLDIELVEGTGFDLLEKLPKRDFELIFVTAYDQYALKAIKFNALDYLLKPVDITELVKAVDKAEKLIAKREDNWRMENLISNMASQKKRIALPLTDTIEFVEVEQIIHLRGEGNYTHVYLSSGASYMVCRPLKEFANLLYEYNFLRVHQSHLINMKEVESYIKSDGGYIKMKDATSIPISRQRREIVMNALKKM